jgi:outer membrane murein-binding lipoprotein Lpp
VVATVIATILVAGCTSSNQSSPQVVSTNASSTTASTTATSSSSAVKASVTPSPTASASPTQVASPTPTASPSTSGKLATTITPSSESAVYFPNPTITRGLPVSWGFEVVPTGVAQILSVPVTVKIDNKAIGTVTPVGHSETVAYSLTGAQTNGLTAGQHTLTVSFAGDSTYQPYVLTQTITVT